MKEVGQKLKITHLGGITAAKRLATVSEEDFSGGARSSIDSVGGQNIITLENSQRGAQRGGRELEGYQSPSIRFGS